MKRLDRREIDLLNQIKVVRFGCTRSEVPA